MDPCSTPEETIVQINTPDERENCYNTMNSIANEARRGQMNDDYILTQHSLKADLRKFRERGRNATMQELQ